MVGVDLVSPCLSPVWTGRDPGLRRRTGSPSVDSSRVLSVAVDAQLTSVMRVSPSWTDPISAVKGHSSPISR